MKTKIIVGGLFVAFLILGTYFIFNKQYIEALGSFGQILVTIGMWRMY